MQARAERAIATITRLFGERGGLLRLAGVVVVLLGSVVFQGRYVDDHWHHVFLTGSKRWPIADRPWWALFEFFSGKPEEMDWFRDQGIVAWWAEPHLRITFFRPLSCLTHLLDYTLWPSHPGLMHLHSLAWYVALVIVAALFFRRVLPPAAGALAGLLYAVDHNHGGIAGWLANRNGIVAATFAVLALVLHDRATRGDRRARWLAALALALGLAGGEAAVGVLGYLAAHALFLDERPLRARVLDLAPLALTTLLWVAVYKAGDYGARGSGAYLDPGRAPLRVLAQAPDHATLLAAAEWGSFGPELELLLSPAGRVVFLGVAVLAAALSLIAIAPRLRARPTTRFFLLGATLSLLPSCATFPATRLLLLPGLGLVGIVAEALVDVAQPVAAPARGLGRAAQLWFAGWVGGAHLLLSPILLVPMAWQIVVLDSMLVKFAESFPPDDPALPQQRLVIVGVPDSGFAGYVAILRDSRGQTVPRGMLPLSAGTRPTIVRRVADDVVEVTAPGGFCQWPTDFLVRDPKVPLPAGTRFRLSDVTIDVVRATPAGIPDVARFTFDGGAAAPSFRWVRWEDAHYVPFALPPVGAEVTVAARAPGS